MKVLLQCCKSVLLIYSVGSLGAAGLPHVLSHHCWQTQRLRPCEWPRAGSPHLGVSRGSSSWDCAFPGVSLRPNCRGTGIRVCRATYLWFTPTWNGSTGCLSHPASSVSAWCLRGLTEGSSHITWRAQICAGLEVLLCK